MVSISWYLSENVRVEMSKTQHFEKFEKVICSELAAKVYIYVCIYTDMGTGRKRRENKKTQNMVSISWYLSEKVRVEMSKTQHFEIFEKVIFPKLAAKNIYIYMYIYGHGHREEAKRERRLFVDDGIPPDKVPYRSRFHRWNGHRHT